jgi:hypothetical protein
MQHSSSLTSASPASRTRAVPWLRRMDTELWLVSEKCSSGGGAMTFSITPPGDAAYRWYSRVREEGDEHRRHEVQREVLAA